MKLQSIMALTPDEVDAIPSPVARLHDLEEENELLHEEVAELKRQLEMKTSQVQPGSPEAICTPPPDDDPSDDRLKMSIDMNIETDVKDVFVVMCSIWLTLNVFAHTQLSIDTSTPLRSTRQPPILSSTRSNSSRRLSLSTSTPFRSIQSPLIPTSAPLCSIHYRQLLSVSTSAPLRSFHHRQVLLAKLSHLGVPLILVKTLG